MQNKETKMMKDNSTIRVLLSFAIGFLIGGFSGFAFGKNKYLKKADEEVQSVKESLKNHYEKKLLETKTDNLNEDVSLVHDSETDEANPVVEEVDEETKAADKIAKKTYTNYASKYSGEHVENKPSPVKKPLKKHIQEFLTEEEFDNSEFIAKGFRYYVKNDLFIDDLDTPLPADDATFEAYILDLIREKIHNSGVDNPKVFYVRDASRKVDYEILIDYEVEYVPSDSDN